MSADNPRRSGAKDEEVRVAAKWEATVLERDPITYLCLVSIPNRGSLLCTLRPSTYVVGNAELGILVSPYSPGNYLEEVMARNNRTVTDLRIENLGLRFNTNIGDLFVSGRGTAPGYEFIISRGLDSPDLKSRRLEPERYPQSAEAFLNYFNKTFERRGWKLEALPTASLPRG